MIAHDGAHRELGGNEATPILGFSKSYSYVANDRGNIGLRNFKPGRRPARDWFLEITFVRDWLNKF